MNTIQSRFTFYNIVNDFSSISIYHFCRCGFFYPHVFHITTDKCMFNMKSLKYVSDIFSIPPTINPHIFTLRNELLHATLRWLLFLLHPKQNRVWLIFTLSMRQFSPKHTLLPKPSWLLTNNKQSIYPV